MLAAQIIAAVIFVLMFVIIILDKFERHYVTLVSGALMIIIVFGICMHSMQAVIDLLNVQSIFTQSFWYGESSEQTSGINWSTIIFIAGMMVMVFAQPFLDLTGLAFSACYFGGADKEFASAGGLV